MKAADRAVVALGAASLFSVVFVFTKGDPWQLVKMPGAGVPIAVVLGVLSCVAGWSGRPAPELAVGLGFLVAAAVVLLELALDADWIGGTASTLSWWAGLGIGVLAAGLAARSANELTRVRRHGHGS